MRKAMVCPAGRFFRPSGAWASSISASPRLTPWAAFFRRSAAAVLGTWYRVPAAFVVLGTGYSQVLGSRDSRVLGARASRAPMTGYSRVRGARDSRVLGTRDSGLGT